MNENDKNNAKEADKTTAPEPDTSKSKASKSKKVKMAIVIACVFAIGCVSYVALENPQLFTVAYWSNKFGSDEPTSMYSNKISSYAFFPSDYAEDVTSDAVYMSLNRYLQIKDGAETVTVTDGNYAAHGALAVFFGNYFDAVIAGDAKTYNTFFTDNYYKSNEPYDRFTPQKLYDILVTILSSTQNDDGTTTYACDVAYKIRRNTGTFRNDIDSDASKTLYFELIEDGGEVRIDRITYYVKG